MRDTAASIRVVSARRSPARRSTRQTRRFPSSSTRWPCCGPRGSPWWCRARRTRRCSGPLATMSQAASSPPKACTTTWRRATSVRTWQRHTSLVGIYFDAGGSPLNAGTVTGYDTARPFSAQNLKLATLVQNDVLGALNAARLDDTEPRRRRRQRARRPGAHDGGRRLRPSPPARPGRTRLVLHAEHDAGRARSSRCSSRIPSKPTSRRARRASR